MPILPAAPMCFPDALFTEPEGDPVERVWWVLHTRPRQEKKLAEFLRDQRVPYFLPLTRKRLMIRGVMRYSYLPLFSGYLFLQASNNERVVALSSRRIVAVLPVADQEQLRGDLTQIHQMIAAGLSVTHEKELLPGTPVEIVSGPLCGLRGEVIRTASGQRFLVRVDFIQQGASVLLDGCNVVPLRGGAM
jgi:transcription antitermination factor NusG